MARSSQVGAVRDVTSSVGRVETIGSTDRGTMCCPRNTATQLGRVPGSRPELLDEAAELRRRDADAYVRRARASMARHCEAMVGFQRAGAEVFDYGNNLRGEAQLGGCADAFSYPGFVPAYLRPLFCEGKGPFRWVALSGDSADIAATDQAVAAAFRDDDALQRWLALARDRIEFQRLPARICWLGYGERAEAGARFNDLVASGAVTAPIVIGRDHLDSGSVASPYRETEAMADGSDAIADWPILNAMLNVASGAAWVAVHHGGGVGMGKSIHAGAQVVGDGTADAAERLDRVLLHRVAGFGVFLAIMFLVFQSLFTWADPAIGERPPRLREAGPAGQQHRARRLPPSRHRSPRGASSLRRTGRPRSAGPIVMADLGRARVLARPVVAGVIRAVGVRPAVELRTGEDVVLVRLVADALDRLPLLGQGRRAGQGVAHPREIQRVAVQVLEITGDGLAAGVEPRSLADSIAGADRVRALRAQVGPPGAVSRAGRGGHRVPGGGRPDARLLEQVLAVDQRAGARVPGLAPDLAVERRGVDEAGDVLAGGGLVDLGERALVSELRRPRRPHLGDVGHLPAADRGHELIVRVGPGHELHVDVDALALFLEGRGGGVDDGLHPLAAGLHDPHRPGVAAAGVMGEERRAPPDQPRQPAAPSQPRSTTAPPESW